MKEYFVVFGSGSAESNTGLSPTFTVFRTASGTTTPPGITEIASTGFYHFTCAPLATLAITFQLDGGSGLGDSDRYIQGVIDPLQSVDQRIGTTSDSFGSTSSDPGTLFGYMKRNQEFLEGDSTFTKSSGQWLIYNRGSTTVLREKTLTNTSSSATKT